MGVCDLDRQSKLGFYWYLYKLRNACSRSQAGNPPRRLVDSSLQKSPIAFLQLISHPHARGEIAVNLPPIFLEFPVPVVQGADLSRLEPT